MEHERAIVIAVSMGADGSTTLSLSPTEDPVNDVRKAVAVLERYAASIERENEPVLCEACGTSPTGARAAPDGTSQLLPCGHSTEADAP